MRIHNFSKSKTSSISWGAKFDSPSATFDLSGEYVYVERNFHIYILIYIYVYMKVAPLLVYTCIEFILDNLIRPGRTQVVQDELVNHG